MSNQVFQCVVTRDMRAQGITGRDAWVTVGDDVIDIAGADGGQLRIRIDDVTRMRVGYQDAKRRTYETSLWTWGQDKPVQLSPTTQAWGAYGGAIRTIVDGMVARQRLGRIERGYSKFDAMLGPVLVGLLVVASAGISIFALGNEPWWGRMIVPAVPLTLFTVLLWLGVSRSWPRPIRDVSELDVQLPPVARR